MCFLKLAVLVKEGAWGGRSTEASVKRTITLLHLALACFFRKH